MDELEQHSRKRNLIVTGVNLHSYVHTATRRSVKASNQQNEGDNICESTMMKKNFISFAEEKLKVSIDEIEITATSRRHGHCRNIFFYKQLKICISIYFGLI